MTEQQGLSGLQGKLEEAWSAPSASLDEMITREGTEGMEQLGTNLAIAGAGLKLWDDFAAANDAREAQKNAFNDALQERKRMFAHNLKRYKENARLSANNVRLNFRQTMESIWQHKIASEQEVANIARESRQAQAEMLSGQADRGVMGTTQDLLINNIQALEMRNIENNRLSQEWAETAKIQQLDEIYAKGETRRMSLIPSPMPAPNVPKLAAMPNIASRAVGAFGDALKNKAAFSGLAGKSEKE